MYFITFDALREDGGIYRTGVAGSDVASLTEAVLQTGKQYTLVTLKQTRDQLKAVPTVDQMAYLINARDL